MNDLKDFVKFAGLLYDGRPLLDIYSQVLISGGCIRLTCQWFNIIMKHKSLEGVEATLDFKSFEHTVSKMPAVTKITQQSENIVSLHGVRDRFDLINTGNVSLYGIRRYTDQRQVDILSPKDFTLMSHSASLVNPNNLSICDYVVASGGHFVGMYTEGEKNIAMLHNKRDRQEEEGYLIPLQMAKMPLKVKANCQVSLAMDGKVKTLIFNFGTMRIDIASPNYEGIPNWQSALVGLDGSFDVTVSRLVEIHKKFSTYKEYTILYGMIEGDSISLSMGYGIDATNNFRVKGLSCGGFPIMISTKVIGHILKYVQTPILKIKYRTIVNGDSYYFMASVNGIYTFCPLISNKNNFKIYKQ